jgi:hypothetical protein
MATNLVCAGVVVALVAATQALAQDAGDVERGRAYVERVCADCHAVGRDQSESPNPNAFPFEAIAHFPGLSATSLFELPPDIAQNDAEYRHRDERPSRRGRVHSQPEAVNGPSLL